MSARSREREQKRSPGVPVFSTEKEARRKKREKGDVIEVNVPKDGQAAPEQLNGMSGQS